MANPEQVALIKQGSKVWNAWFEHQDIGTVDLSGANLSEVDLSSVKLSFVNLARTCFMGADLRGAELVSAFLRNADLGIADLRSALLDGSDLQGASLNGANFEGAVLTRANLSDAEIVSVDFRDSTLNYVIFDRAELENSNLGGADLTGASLKNANLRDTSLVNAVLRSAKLIGAIIGGADLDHADLDGADLTDCNFAGAHLVRTKILNCTTVHKTLGLDAVNHDGACSLDAVSLRSCINDVPDVFLEGVGYNREEIETLRGLYGKAFRYYSCFISYTRADGDFASKLHSDLQSKGVSCWKDDIDLKGGDYWLAQINEAIRLKDKTILICSERSLSRSQVVREILKSMEIERERGIRKLFPIRIDDYIWSDDFTIFAEEQVATGEWKADWLPKIRAFHIPEFSSWKDHDQYVEALDKLVKDLKKNQ